MDETRIVSIPVKMEKYYGCGSMLHPSTQVVQEAIGEIPLGKILVLDDLCKKLANDFDVKVTCPLRILNAVKRISESLMFKRDSHIPFWRVVRKNGKLVKSESSEFCMAKLEDEGFTLVLKKSNDIHVDFDLKRQFKF